MSLLSEKLKENNFQKILLKIVRKISDERNLQLVLYFSPLDCERNMALPTTSILY